MCCLQKELQRLKSAENSHAISHKVSLKIFNAIQTLIIFSFHRDRPYQCNICNATFLTASQRSVHIDKHETKNYKCEICSKVFQTRVHLQSHYKNHTGSINCPICGNLYASQKSLECHLRIHKKAEKEKELVEVWSEI